MTVRRGRGPRAAVQEPAAVCRHCRRRPSMPDWRCCRSCWDRLFTTGPLDLPTEEEGIALRFAARYEQLRLDLEDAA